MPMSTPQSLNLIYYDNLRQASMKSKSKKVKDPKVKTSTPSSQPTKDYAAAFASLQQQFGASGQTPCPAYTPKSKT